MIYITGAEGFIGKNLVNKLKLENKDFLCCDPRNKKMIHPDELFDSFKKVKPSIIYHLGAVSSTTETNLESICNNNIFFSCKLLEYSIKNNVTFIYASSASVYGHGEYGFKESVITTPLNYYAISKATFDLFVFNKIKEHANSKIFGLRYFNVYGQGEEHKQQMASPIYKFFNQALTQNKIEVFAGSEKIFRDFIHVDDVVLATISSQYFGSSGIYNVGTSTPRTFMDVANIISNLTNCSIEIIDFPELLKNKYQFYTSSNNTKINLVHTNKRIDLEEGIKKIFYG